MQYKITDEELTRARNAGIRFIKVNGRRLEVLTKWGRWTPHSRYKTEALVEQGIEYIQRNDPGMVLINDEAKT